jgi:hypothetical protein
MSHLVVLQIQIICTLPNSLFHFFWHGLTPMKRGTDDISDTASELTGRKARRVSEQLSLVPQEIVRAVWLLLKKGHDPTIVPFGLTSRSFLSLLVRFSITCFFKS